MHTILQVLGYVTEKKKNARDILKWRFPPGVGETAFGVFLSKARTWLNALHDRYEVVAGITRGVDDGPLEPGTEVVGANFDGYQQHLNYAPATVQSQEGDKVHVVLAGGDRPVVSERPLTFVFALPLLVHRHIRAHTYTPFHHDHH